MGTSPDAVRVKFNLLRRGAGGNNVTAAGILTPPSSPPKKRKAREIKEESDDDGELEDRSVKTSKKVKHGRSAATKAADRIREVYELSTEMLKEE